MLELEYYVNLFIAVSFYLFLNVATVLELVFLVMLLNRSCEHSAIYSATILNGILMCVMVLAVYGTLYRIQIVIYTPPEPAMSEAETVSIHSDSSEVPETQI